MRHVQLTKTNGPRESLLSKYRRTESPTDTVAPKLKSTPKRASPDIHAAPLSSDEDRLDSLNEPELPTSTHDAKDRPKLVPRSRNGVRSSSSNASSSPQRHRAARRNGATASGSPKRTADDLKDEESTSDELNLFSLSQSQKRPKKLKAYGGPVRGGGTGRRDDQTSKKDDDTGPASKVTGNGWKAPLTEQDVDERCMCHQRPIHVCAYD